MGRRLNGFDVSYTSRGSWTVDLKVRGEIVETIPVAWTRDYKTPLMKIWFKSEYTASLLLEKLEPIKVALARRGESGASVDNITNLFLVMPEGLGDNEEKPGSVLIARVLSKVMHEG